MKKALKSQCIIFSVFILFGLFVSCEKSYETEKSKGNFKNIRIITEWPKKYTNLMDIHALTAE